MTTLNVRIEEKTKKAASKVLADIGLDLSTGIRLFLNQVANDKDLPFMPSKNSKALRAKWDREVEWALKNGKRYDKVDELMRDLEKGNRKR